MRAKTFIKQLREEEIVAAIQAAERKTSGELRVFVSDHAVDDPVAAAKRQFRRLGMEKTGERNGVLIFLAPGQRAFAVIGDTAVHARCGDGFWQELARVMTEHFRATRFTEGVLEGIQRAGELLAEHFPRRPDDINELPDRVEHS
ncbi:hypothetical protein GC207_14855 [bacterium]|nr:hypothetical protein [bacterium]